MNPADGQLYVVGFQVWGTTAKALSGLARVRYTGAPRVLMKELTATDKGVILRFNVKLDARRWRRILQTTRRSGGTIGGQRSMAHRI
jgi:hypothetical protein